MGLSICTQSFCALAVVSKFASSGPWRAQDCCLVEYDTQKRFILVESFLGGRGGDDAANVYEYELIEVEAGAGK